MSYKNKLKDIKAFVFDVDGVFTDGSVFLLPDGSMSRVMNVLDGYACMKAQKEGFLIGIITGGDDPMVKNRLQYLGIEDIYTKSSDKTKDYNNFKQKHKLEDSQILYMGDDLPDIAVLQQVAISCCPINAVAEVKQVCDYISNIHGGKGAVRDVIEQVLKQQEKWNQDHTKSV